MIETCPKCHKETLRVINVMGTTERISYHCSNCCYREKRDYQGNIVEQSKIIDAELLQEQQRAPYTFRGMTIREVPIDEPVKGHVEQGYFRSAKEGLKIWGNTHRSE